MKKVLCLDVETQTYNKGNPFDPRNFLVSVVTYDGKETRRYYKDFTGLREQIQLSDLFVGFNAKFDLHWINNLGIDTSHLEIWDCQYAEFLLERQTNAYPSLENTAIKYELGHKIDVIKEEYWNKGIQTDEIPQDILLDYNQQDVMLTWQIYQKQQTELTDQQKRLFWVCMQDLHVLKDMERTGVRYESDASLLKSDELQAEINNYSQQLQAIAGGSWFNPGSNDHLSALLYGGSIVEEYRVSIGTYKSGAKVGQTRYKVMEVEHKLPRLVEPLKNSEYKKGGVWSTEDTILQVLPVNGSSKKIRELIWKIRELSKLNSTYLVGFPRRIEKMNWENNTIHTTFNQCVAQTGRLSSTNPNMQNLGKEVKQYCVSTYANH